MALKGCSRVVDASTGSESRIEVSRTSSKRMGSAGGRSGEVTRVGSSGRLGSPKGVDVAKDARDRESDLSRLCAELALAV